MVMEMLLFVRLDILSYFGFWLLGQSHLSKMNCITQIAKDPMVHCASC